MSQTRKTARIALSLTTVLVTVVVGVTGGPGFASPLLSVFQTSSPTPTPYVSCIASGVPPTAPSPLCRTITPTPAESATPEVTTSPSPTTPPKGGKKSRSEASVVSLRYAASTKSFLGVVTSHNACIKRRVVEIRKDVPGSDALVGSDKTDKKGGYTISVERARGKFYAVVLESAASAKYGKLLTCETADSKVLTIRSPKSEN